MLSAEDQRRRSQRLLAREVQSQVIFEDQSPQLTFEDPPSSRPAKAAAKKPVKRGAPGADAFPETPSALSIGSSALSAAGGRRSASLYDKKPMTPSGEHKFLPYYMKGKSETASACNLRLRKKTRFRDVIKRCELKLAKSLADSEVKLAASYSSSLQELQNELKAERQSSQNLRAKRLKTEQIMRAEFEEYHQERAAEKAALKKLQATVDAQGLGGARPR
eukprot:gnl/TRDRNA2_/TRDRNA2_85271_c0_seq1.p1 gnl/TRDRNA2_/TRDRNA2_85271_c0~~gnl/TRDRNA2_/TRDRNA2_85271_c0_seq1.p1  ORF type:complete len:220 (+),score=57.23 gnl/TRDRNA2_/TRDRNA2_85271_c0_seq1:25-684(+)